MNIESKIWTYAGTGTKVHAFVDGVALCRKNLRNDPARVERMGHDYAGAVYYASVCSNCQTKFNAAIEREEAHQARLENSLAPSTGEGDYLPPAQETPAPAGTRTHHYNATGGQRFIAGRGWVNHCQVCQAPEGTGDHFHNPTAPQRTTNEEDSLPIDNGPLTERQTAIIGHVRVGLRYRKVAEQVGISEVLVRREVVAITRKLRATTFQQAICLYTTAQAYLQVADVLDGTGREHPQRDEVAEDHVDRVLKMLAAIYRDRAARLLPQ